MLAVSGGLEMALHANRIAYLGSVFLPLSMLMIILNITNPPHPPKLSWMLLGFAAVIFLLTASPGILDVYYKEVSFEVVNGVSTLVKVYGPLHPVYLFYLIGYFTAMVVVIIRSNIKKTINSTAYAVIIASAVFVNIGVWFTEQMVHMDFEMLSISYLISELFLLVTHLLLKETQQVKEFLHHIEASLDQSSQQSPSDMASESDSDADLTKINTFLTGLGNLTPTENAIYNAHTSRMTTKEILANMNIKENTLKYHNRNIYGKLGVSSKKELLEVYKKISTIKDVIKK
jgi:DNA-binding CsgD family transcriptional regulator